MTLRLLIAIPPILVLASCASRPPKKIVVIPAVDSSHLVRQAMPVRAPEEVRAYQFGRYIDPTDRTVMHDAHPVFRLERSAHWNLYPGWFTAQVTAPAKPSQPAAILSQDAAVAELNRQKSATKAFTEQAATLNQSLSTLGTALTKTEKIAADNLLLQQSVAGLKTRLDTLERQSRESAHGAPRTTPTREENW